MLDGRVERLLVAGEADGLIEIVHRQLCHTTAQRHALTFGNGGRGLLQAVDDVSHVLKALPRVGFVGLMGDRLFTLAVVVGVGLGEVELVGLEQKQGCELLVLVVDAWGEAQVVEHEPSEQIAACRCPQVVVMQIRGASHRSFNGDVVFAVASRLCVQTEEHHVGIVLLHPLQALAIGVAEQTVVAVDKLNVAACGNTQAVVASHAQTAVLLPQVDHAILPVREFGKGCHFAAVVDQHNLTFVVVKSQRANALQTLAEQLVRHVVGGDDEAH